MDFYLFFDFDPIDGAFNGIYPSFFLYVEFIFYFDDEGQARTCNLWSKKMEHFVLG